jgi:hypothetical protein
MDEWLENPLNKRVIDFELQFLDIGNCKILASSLRTATYI